MLYAEYESYHFLSISRSAYVRKNPMTASESSAEGEDEMLLCSLAAKCQEQIKARTPVTVIPNNQMENVSQDEECQARATVCTPAVLSGSYLLVITCACSSLAVANLTGCRSSRNFICRRESGGRLDCAATGCLLLQPPTRLCPAGSCSRHDESGTKEEDEDGQKKR